MTRFQRGIEPKSDTYPLGVRKGGRTTGRASEMHWKNLSDRQQGCNGSKKKEWKNENKPRSSQLL